MATQDTVTLIRGAIRGLLREADDELEAQLRSVLKRDDEYRSAGKPVCDWDDKTAREALVDELAHDGYAALLALDGHRLVPIQRAKDGGGLASFAHSCTGCALRAKCTKSIEGRSIRVHPREATLQRSRERQRDPAWKARYRATRPKVERKFAHLMFRRHGGRRARVHAFARARAWATTSRCLPPR